MFFSCNKEKICNEISAGEYEGWFTNSKTSKTHYNSILYLTVADENTIIINTTGKINSQSAHVQINDCHVEGNVGAMIGAQSKNLKIDGKIRRNIKGDYIIEGRYKYFENSGGLGNPNSSYYEIHGIFKIKSK